MNRFQRRAEASTAKNGQSGGLQRATKSFGDMVSQANTNALKPFIIECMNELEGIIRQDLARQYLDALAPIQTRLMVLEKLTMEKLGETNDSLAQRLLDVEDEATGYQATTSPAEAGDFLRVTTQVRVAGQDKYSRPMKLNIVALAKLRQNPETGGQVYQTYEDLEKALVGATTGETREVEIVITNGEVKVNYTFKATVDRVSVNVKERAARVEAALPTAEVANG